MKIYGIKACDTCRKALKEFEGLGLNVEFVDVRADPPSAQFYEQVFANFGGSSINQRSKTWREMTELDRNMPHVDMFMQFPTVMKRPVIEHDGEMTLGWTADVKARWMGIS